MARVMRHVVKVMRLARSGPDKGPAAGSQRVTGRDVTRHSGDVARILIPSLYTSAIKESFRLWSAEQS